MSLNLSWASHFLSGTCGRICDPAQAILPTLTDSRGVFACNVRRNARYRQIDAHPVNNPTSLLARLHLLAALQVTTRFLDEIALKAALLWRRPGGRLL